MSGIKANFRGQEIHVNPDKDYVKEIRDKLKANGGYCPCRLSKNEDTKCICKEFREQEEDGYCHCGLYFKEFEKSSDF